MKMSDNQSIVKGSSFYAYAYAYAEARTLQLCRHKRRRLRQWGKYLLFVFTFVLWGCIRLPQKDIWVWESENELTDIMIAISSSDSFTCSLSYNFLNREPVMRCDFHHHEVSCEEGINESDGFLFAELAKKVVERKKKVYEYKNNVDANSLFIVVKANNKVYNFVALGFANNEITMYKTLYKIDPIFAIIYHKMDCYKCKRKQ